MSSVEWALLCDVAYFDASRNLCMIGVQTQPVPCFPIGTRRVAIAALVPGLPPHPRVTVSILTPDGAASTPAGCEHVVIETAGDHLLANIGVAPLIDDGIYRFEVTVSSPPIAIDLPIVIAGHRSCERPLFEVYPIDVTKSAPRGMDHVGLD